MRRISIKEAARMMGLSNNEELVRESIRQNKIPGAYYLLREGKERGMFYITDEQVTNMMKGAIPDEG